MEFEFDFLALLLGVVVEWEMVFESVNLIC